MLPAQRSGKVKVGQRVIIRFTSYPDQEFGIVKGQVSSISLVPNQNNYMIEILLPDGLHTNYKKELPFSPEMEAQADIITDDLRLIERFFMPLKKSLRKVSNLNRKKLRTICYDPLLLSENCIIKFKTVENGIMWRKIKKKESYWKALQA